MLSNRGHKPLDPTVYNSARGTMACISASCDLMLYHLPISIAGLVWHHSQKLHNILIYKILMAFLSFQFVNAGFEVEATFPMGTMFHILLMISLSLKHDLCDSSLIVPYKQMYKRCKLSKQLMGLLVPANGGWCAAGRTVQRTK